LPPTGPSRSGIPGKGQRGKRPACEGPQGFEEVEVGAKIGLAVQLAASVEPAKALIGMNAQKAPRTRLRVSIAVPHASQDSNIHLQASHHLMHPGRSPFYATAHNQMHSSHL
jgi:hypothetical protein